MLASQQGGSIRDVVYGAGSEGSVFTVWLRSMSGVRAGQLGAEGLLSGQLRALVP